ncbi:CHAT domain-containing protein [Okeania sp. SIO2B3]|uniref:CHAT domain-containing protein n=1 Tax=Okeania sp. SIO2B3 TaxID=2607784 RepID=UPI0013BFB806|nr:CHAT domain-containing protein [Okeania sp. SIO2B3]NET42726.1 CHAT domain-containing protein [Okeania sp. SIO2B3]
MEQEFIDLIKQLLACRNQEEVNKVLSTNQQLIVPSLLPVMAQAAEYLANNDNFDGAKFLSNLILKLGIFLGNSQKDSTIRKETANVLLEIGVRWSQTSLFTFTFQCCQQTITIFREIKDRMGELASFEVLGVTYGSHGQYKQAIECHQQCLEITREIKNRELEAGALVNLGLCYTLLGQYQQAIEFFQKALEIAQSQEIKDRELEAEVLVNIGIPYRYLGQFDQAIKFHKQSLEIAREITYHKIEAGSLGNLGICYLVLGQYERAIDFLLQQLKIAQKIGDRQGEANAIANLGLCYLCLEKYEQAIEYFQIARNTSDPRGQAKALGNIGFAYSKQGKYEQGIDFLQQQLEIVQKIEDFQGEGSALGNLGFAYSSQEKYEQAIEFYQQSLTIAEKIEDRQTEAVALGNLGTTYYYLEQHKQAIAHLQKSLKIATPKTMPVDCARNADSLGYLFFIQGNWEDAIKAYTQAIEATEILRTGRKTDNSRQEILKNAIRVYNNIIQSFVNTGQYAQALTYAEQSRNRQLVDLMYSKDIYSQGETRPEVIKLLQQYEEIQRQLDNLRFNNKSPNYYQGTLDTTNSRQISASWQARNDRITTLEADKQKIYRQIRKFDEVLAEGLAVNPLELDKLQNLVRDRATTAIVSFFSTLEDTYAFILVGNRVDLHHCGHGLDDLQRWLLENWFEPYVWSGMPESDRPPSSPIVAAKLLGCDPNTIDSVDPEIDTVTVFFKDGSSQSLDESEFEKLESTYLFWDEQMPSNLKEISQRLQLDKLVEKLTGIQELIVIPHLYLHQIPFAALPLADNKYLGDQFLIRTLSSCQTLDFCTQRPPISTPTPAYGIVENTREDLPFSSFEAQKVAQIYNTDKYLQGNKATVSNYKELLKEVQGLLSSHHAKSRFDNSLESELTLADGRITLSDLLSPAFRFPDLDEVFLSCCETNLGTTEITDDTMTLNTGFLCAGARGVISSLWAVNDLATSLFSFFYHQKRKTGFNRPQALQKAQQDLRHLTGKEFEREYYQELEQLLNKKLQLASQKKAAAKQKLDGCAENAPEYQQLQFEYEERERVEKKISKIIKEEPLKKACQKEHPFEHPEYWSGFICAGLR